MGATVVVFKGEFSVEDFKLILQCRRNACRIAIYPCCTRADLEYPFGEVPWMSGTSPNGYVQPAQSQANVWF